MGRPRLPTATHELKGSFIKNPQRRPKAEPKPTGPLGAPPKELPEGVKTAWLELAKIVPPRVLTNADRWIVEMAARLMADLRSKGDLSGAKWSRLESCLARLGMTPSDRSKVIALPEDDAKSPWDSLGALQVIRGGKKA